MSAKTATLIGVTGLVGGHLYELLLQDNNYSTIRLIVRRPFAKKNERTEVKLVDFNDAESLKLAIDGSDILFCAIGTTQKKVKGDQTAYRKIDYDIPVRSAQFCKETRCEEFVLVSSVGASYKSRNFYLRLKGETEEAIKAIGLRAVHIMRPSMLLGRRNKYRLSERISKAIMAPLAFLLPSRFRPIQAKAVAMAMLKAADENREGFFVYEYKKIKKLNEPG